MAPAAALIGDPARAAMLIALADGRALPAGELAAIAGLSLPGTSAHLSRLLMGGLVVVERQGRHRYYRLSGPQVATALEAMAALVAVPRHSRTRLRASDSLRHGRTCYDHIAGELGVAIGLALDKYGFVSAGEGRRLNLTKEGIGWLNRIGINAEKLRSGPHGIACRCLDWTERRYHVAGPLGAAMLQLCRQSRWIVPAGGSPRAIKLSPRGAAWMRNELGVVLPI